ncbi:MAG: hypothetical protein WBD50_00220, partial [Candidatus Rhabdochlamydia sp.]
MPISPTSPNLPGPSLDLFSYFPDAVEPQEISSTQELALKDRIKSVIDCWGYKVYSSFNRPLIRPEGFAEVVYQVKKRKFFAKKPQSYEEARTKVLNDPLGLCEWSWGHRLEKENLKLYSDPEFRKERVKAYADSLFDGTAELFEDRKEEHWLIMTFCEEELHDLYRREPKYLREDIAHDLHMIKAYNKPILAEHKKEWDQLSPSEKAEKIFGKRRKYEVTAGVSFVAAC